MLWTADPAYLYWLAFMAAAFGMFALSKRITYTGNDVPVTRGSVGREISLVQAMRDFLNNPTMAALVAMACFAWGFRIYVGQWGWRDAVAIVIVAILWPFAEWVTHVLVLHARPYRFLGIKFDSVFAQIHRAHHRNPYDVKFGAAPPAALVQYGMIIPGILAMLVLWPRSITMSAMMITMVCRYEWWHHLIHSSYKPKSRWFRKLRDHHWWHHFQDEHNWYGVTSTGGDRLFRTNPDPKSVSRSETCRTLGQELPQPEPVRPFAPHQKLKNPLRMPGAIKAQH